MRGGWEKLKGSHHGLDAVPTGCSGTPGHGGLSGQGQERIAGPWQSLTAAEQALAVSCWDSCWVVECAPHSLLLRAFLGATHRARALTHPLLPHSSHLQTWWGGQNAGKRFFRPAEAAAWAGGLWVCSPPSSRLRWRRSAGPPEQLQSRATRETGVFGQVQPSMAAASSASQAAT